MKIKIYSQNVSLQKWIEEKVYKAKLHFEPDFCQQVCNHIRVLITDNFFTYEQFTWELLKSLN